MNTLRHALRQLLRTPGFSLIVILSLALGIGANTIVFSWIDTILLRPLPGVRHGEDIVALLPTIDGNQVGGHTISLPDIQAYDEMDTVFAGVIGSQITPANVRIGDRHPWLFGQIVTGNFFEVLGVQALPDLGRVLHRNDTTSPGGNPVLVLSEATWRSQFGADPAIVGREIELNQHPFTIVGVVPANFRGTMSGLTADFWAPVTMHREVANFGSLETRTDRWLHSQARLQPGVSIDQARAAVTVRGQQLAETYPENRRHGAVPLPMWQTPYGGQAVFLPALRVLAVVGLVILLLVTANVANLLVARATARQQETAIRLAVGAGRRHLVQQWLTESLLYAVLGGAVGLLVTVWGASFFAIFLPESPLPAGYEFAITGRVLGVTLALSLLTGVVFGLAPALLAIGTSVLEALKAGGRTGSMSGRSHRLRNALVIGEVALALVLLAGAALCIRGSQQARQIDPGFDPSGVLVSGLRIGMNGYDEERGLVFYQQLRERLAATPGVEAVGLASWFPLGFEGGPSIGITVPGYTPTENENMAVPYAIISAGYLEAMRIPLRAGRDFTDLDDGEHPLVMIVNEALAERYWPGQDAVGRKVQTWRGEATVVGVTPTGRYRSLNEPAQPFLYFADRQGVADLNLGIALRTTGGDPRQLLPTLRQAVAALDPNVELWATLPLSEYIEAAHLVNRVATTLLTGLGVIALLLASMGIYGVMAFMVGRRLPEFGIRLALGAAPKDVAGLVLRDGLRLVALGLLVGSVGAWAAGVGLASALPGVSSHDVSAMIGVALLLTGIALLACWLPARRAMRVDPIQTLQAQ
ncbi:ABC transporter permease [Actomonas aquatica]|uniref:ABC transporter permease n=1 Tax=Actomonas aquatica TaxID=2866162 RepID=A0ABZ1C9P8_9BACT|nr:ABC transporter permease [Opitutus sp. WL0086]WRQ88375.1 ABC transporter permease [Opitutus sp. WL0086]